MTTDVQMGVDVDVYARRKMVALCELLIVENQRGREKNEKR